MIKTAIEVMTEINESCNFMSVEKPCTKASKSEIKRWLDQNGVEVNFQSIKPNDEWPIVLKSLVLFPKSKNRRSTLFFDETIAFIQINEL